jgi:hypothetical protein
MSKWDRVKTGWMRIKRPKSQNQNSKPQEKRTILDGYSILGFYFKKIVSLAFQNFLLQIDKRKPYSQLKELIRADTLEFGIWDFGLGSYAVLVYVEMRSGKNWLDAH